MNFKILASLTAILFILVLPACDAGPGPEEKAEPPCASHIEDGTFEGAYRAILGFGEGANAALRMSLAVPGRFNVTVALDGPTEARRTLAELDNDIKNFDDWPAEPSRNQRISRMHDLLGAFGNPFYLNDASNFYPPGVTAADFVGLISKTAPGLICPENPDGSLPSVTIIDVSGVPVDFLLAVDLNQNGERDPGEPIIAWMHEPFDDLNENGRWDSGEPFSDFGLDGVADTGDYGEGNGIFDENPRLAYWLANDPLTLLAGANIDYTPGYRQSFYLDAATDDLLGYNEQIGQFADQLAQNAAVFVTGASFCITNTLGRYTAFQSSTPVPTAQIWFAEKFVLQRFSGSTENFWDDDQLKLREYRFTQALSFISLRMPNGLDDNVPKESPVIWQIRSFHSAALDAEVDFGIGFPAGYFDGRDKWKSYPVIYVLHDRASTLNNWWELVQFQGDLANRKLAKQAIIVVADGTRESDDRHGYGYYIDQAAPEIGGSYGLMVDELIEYVEATFRVQTEAFDRDDDK